MAIEALEQQPSEDCISRQAAQAKIKSICDKYNLTYEDGERTGGSGYAFGHAFDELPPVIPQPKMGRWIPEINDYGEVMRWHCDRCYEDTGFTTTCKWDFCPNCGAEMGVEGCR